MTRTATDSAAIDLTELKAPSNGLSLEERKVVVEQASVLFEQNYAHLPLKRALHGVDPVQRLRLLRSQLESMDPCKMPTDSEFHDEIDDIFTSVRDLHTQYLLPSPFLEAVAFMPFLIEEFYQADETEPRFMVSFLGEGFTHPTFEAGVEILYWNGVPIKRAIEINGEGQAGSNPDARFARGLDTLTIRPLAFSLAPSEEWVVITYRTVGGQTLELRQRWLVKTWEEAQRTMARRRGAGNAHLAIDLQKAMVNQTRKMLFAPDALAAQRKLAAGGRRPVAVAPADISTCYPGILEARNVNTPSGTFGHLRIYSFEVDDIDGFINEVARLVGLVSQQGLIIDVRGNGGGVIEAGEGLLQLFTPAEIVPESFEFLNTQLNLSLTQSAPEGDGLGLWSASIAESVETGAVYSLGFQLSPPDLCNSIGQIYYGPVVLVVDALCYSTTDMFTGGFQDHEIGEILGTAGNTGAGGANVWEHQDLRAILKSKPGSPYERLPRDIGMRVALLRSRRVGTHAGAVLEELGVVPTHVHRITRNDLTMENIDLINEAAAILAKKTVYTLSVTASPVEGGGWAVTAVASNLARLDVYVNQHAFASRFVSDGKTQFILGEFPLNSAVLLQGFDGDDHLVASAAIKLDQAAASSGTSDASSPPRVAGQNLKDVIVSYRSIADAYSLSTDSANDAIKQGLEAASDDPAERARMMSSFTNALHILESSERTPGVLVAPCDQYASLLQTYLEKHAVSKNRLAPLSARPGMGAAQGFETKFDDHDIAGWFGSFFTWIKGIKKHPWLAPPSVPEMIDNITQIGLLGDWGTGRYGAPVCAHTIEGEGAAYKLLIHLGDVYYAGETQEVQDRFLDDWPKNPGAVSRALNSNHEMYTGGYGYFDETLKAFDQSSSCVALQNDSWLILGLDTGYRESLFNGWQGGIDSDQTDWVKKLIDGRGSRRVILMSHHQPFTLLDTLGNNLAQQLGEILAAKNIFAWYWGHEHRCVVYDQHPSDGYYGRCIGHSGYPYFKPNLTNDPQDPNWPSFRRIPGKAGLPGALVLDEPNPYVDGDPNQYGAQGFMKLQIDGPAIHEIICLPDGTEIYKNTLA